MHTYKVIEFARLGTMYDGPEGTPQQFTLEDMQLPPLRPPAIGDVYYKASTTLDEQFFVVTGLVFKDSIFRESIEGDVAEIFREHLDHELMRLWDEGEEVEQDEEGG